ncbi:hypothetical protein DCO56_28580 [Sphingobacterium athyrii]|uniref:Uncharacterized protein n=1 Tax=Sphingobacterium athyrii TaxID=2152717 RepID=A0A363NK45_9SPHI|nr:hypothetical protein DCO56_28580 [Sphingobacterium athyrii]
MIEVKEIGHKALNIFLFVFNVLFINYLCFIFSDKILIIFYWISNGHPQDDCGPLQANSILD